MQQVEAGGLSLGCVLPLTAEWNLAALALLACSYTIGITIIPAIMLLAAGPLWALYYAWRVKIEPCHDGFLCAPVRRAAGLDRANGTDLGTLALSRGVQETPRLICRRVSVPSISWFRRTRYPGLLERAIHRA